MWQPIESAPKDGTDILGYFPDWKRPIAVTCWMDYKSLDHGVVTYHSQYWFTGIAMNKSNPTHWMPLPDPPSH